MVANEVKELAKETARATEEIGNRIGAIQTDSHSAVEAIANISQIIKRINAIQTTIATAVEEQTSVTNSIGRTVTEAAQGNAEVTANIGTVANAATDTLSGVNNTQTAAQELANLAGKLQNLVGRFRLEPARPGSEHRSVERRADSRPWQQPSARCQTRTRPRSRSVPRSRT